MSKLSLKSSGLSLLFLLFSFHLIFAEEYVDSVWAAQKNNEPYLQHFARKGETLMMLASRFKVPAASVARLNKLSYTDPLTEWQLIKIPLVNNYLRSMSEPESEPLYYRVDPEIKFKSICKMFSLSQSSLLEWNKLVSPEVRTGQVLLIGWVKYDKDQVPWDVLQAQKAKEEELRKKEAKEKAKNEPQKIDTVVYTSPLGEEFHQYNDGRTLREASATAVFFESKINDDSKDAFALYDDASRGTILSIYNPASKRVVYAKVVGSLPKVSQYQNAQIALSKNAAGLLQAREEKVFVRIKY